MQIYNIHRELPGERDNARNNVRCMKARKATHGLDGQHQDVDRTLRGRVNQNDRRQGKMEKVRPWCGQPSNRGRLKNRTIYTGKMKTCAIKVKGTIYYLHIQNRNWKQNIQSDVLGTIAVSFRQTPIVETCMDSWQCDCSLSSPVDCLQTAATLRTLTGSAARRRVTGCQRWSPPMDGNTSAAWSNFWISPSTCESCDWELMTRVLRRSDRPPLPHRCCPRNHAGSAACLCQCQSQHRSG